LTAERPLRTTDFDYELPPELVAQQPAAERSASRLLVVVRGERRTAGRPDDRSAGRRGWRGADMLPGEQRASAGGVLVDAHFARLTSLIPAGDLLVLNTTRVRHARLLGTRPSGAPAEVLLIQPCADDTWLAMGKPGSAMQPGKRIALGPGAEIETVEVLPDGNRRIRFVGLPASDALRRFGRIPLPPYITRDPTALDEIRYQTVYARQEGSVAAPTAGLHFTPEILDALTAKGVLIAGLDLEVGPGTFKPVESDDPAEHRMHPERYEIPARLAALLEIVRERAGLVWAVGTTVVRALESAADEQGRVRAGAAETSLMITPGYGFRVVDRLLTNFHLPRSTLLMLVSAFAGRELALDAYRHAVAERYRFYSYGDAMVIL
jgi:S-adenosylmethionine:tRNA ribosyltransferase-isomerase